tara:strand:+ start:1291 stop:1527 length:237 start_codon:yes stop_codon:yes gene_type:complete
MNQIVTSSLISVIFFILKFIEMRLILKENKPLKDLFKETLLVFISATLSLVILEQFNLNELIGNIKSVPSVFVSKPDF